jgi:hypothetical protein
MSDSINEMVMRRRDRAMDLEHMHSLSPRATSLRNTGVLEVATMEELERRLGDPSLRPIAVLHDDPVGVGSVHNVRVLFAPAAD